MLPAVGACRQGGLRRRAFGMIARGTAFAFRKSVAGLQVRRLLGAAFAVSSLVTPYFLGSVVGGVASGRVPPGIAAGSSIIRRPSRGDGRSTV